MSCGKKEQDENIDGRTYTSRDIGWTINIPDRWEIVSQDRLEKLDKKGLEAIESVVEGSVDYSKLKHLISFSNNQFNIFQSTIEPFESEYDGEWEDINKALKEIILRTYKENGIRADATEISNESIDGLVFQKYEVTLYSPKGEVFLRQLMYSKLINGFDFGLSISYNNSLDKNIMLKAWRDSRFDSPVDYHN